MKMLSFAAALAVAVGYAANAHAQAYPSHPITMIVPFPPGGPTDTVGRVMAEHMKISLGQTLVIENVTGAGARSGLVGSPVPIPTAIRSASDSGPRTSGQALSTRSSSTC